MTYRAELQRRAENLQNRMGRCVPHMGRNGRFDAAWHTLWHQLADALDAVLDEEDEYYRDLDNDRKLDESRGK